jgi:uncharacterized membrane protein
VIRIVGHDKGFDASIYMEVTYYPTNVSMNEVCSASVIAGVLSLLDASVPCDR